MIDLRSLFPAMALLAFLGCGSKDPTPSQPATTAGTLDTDLAVDTNDTFLEMEGDLATPDTLPCTVPAGEALSVSVPELPACITKQELSPTSVKFTYTACTGPHGGTVNGVVLVSWNANHTVYQKEFRDLVMARDGRSWTLNGTRTLTLDREAKRSTITTRDFHKTWKDATTTKDFRYNSSLTADWAVQGHYQLWGGFTVALDGEPLLQGTIPISRPLTWEKGCCHPLSGTLELKKNDKEGILVFGPTCGAVRVNGQLRILRPCGQGR